MPPTGKPSKRGLPRNAPTSPATPVTPAPAHTPPAPGLAPLTDRQLDAIVRQAGGTEQCPRCKMTVLPGANFCVACGQSMTITVNPATTLYDGRCREIANSLPPTSSQEGLGAKLAALMAEAALPEDVYRGNTPDATLVPNKDQFPPQQPNRKNGQPPHVMVRAGAGTGKTFTLVVGLCWAFRNRVKGLWEKLVSKLGFDPVPSPQQQAVWDEMRESYNARSVQFCAFNRSIVKDFEQKWGWLIDVLNDAGIKLQFRTMHSTGLYPVRKTFNLGAGEQTINKYRVQEIICELLGTDIRVLRASNPLLLEATEELVGLCKLNLSKPLAPTLYGPSDNPTIYDPWADELDRLVAHYDVDVEDDRGKSYRNEIYQLVPRVLEHCKDVKRDMCIDYNDMVWLPVVLDLPVWQHDLLLVDESQDLNRAQQELAKKAGRRLIFVGDSRQAIYGFAGADSESMNRLARDLANTDRDVVELPLTVTRRCGKAIVKEANTVVEDFHAHESNPEGKVSRANYPIRYTGRGVDARAEELPLEQTYIPQVQDVDYIISRVNAPLVKQCFKFLKLGRKASIIGRDIGQGIIKTIKKLEATGVPELVAKVTDWLQHELAKEQAKRHPSEARLITLQDKADCILCFCEGATTVEGVLQRVESIFTDETKVGVRLSSIHRVKGMEAKRVFFIRCKAAPCPHPMAKSSWQKEQEMNLLYVGITRAIEELVYVV